MRQDDPLTIRYGDGVAVHPVEGLLVGEGEDGLRIDFMLGNIAGQHGDQRRLLHPPTPETERAVTRIYVAKIRGRELVLKTGPLDKAFAAWRQCTDQLVRSWGLDPVQQAHRPAPAGAQSDPGTWLQQQLVSQ